MGLLSCGVCLCAILCCVCVSEMRVCECVCAVITVLVSVTSDVHITNDMCVTHFLIQPTTGGIKLQGWNECSFRK